MALLQRRRRDVVVTVGSPEALRSALASAPGPWRARPGQLRGAVRDDGQVRARLQGNGGRTSPGPPVLRGRLVAHELTGVVREHWGEALLPRLMAASSLLLAVSAVGALLARGPLVAVAVCAPSALVLGYLARALSRARAAQFEGAADALVAEVRAQGRPPAS